jgi:hypothetical protein
VALAGREALCFCQRGMVGTKRRLDHSLPFRRRDEKPAQAPHRRDRPYQIHWLRTISETQEAGQSRPCERRKSPLIGIEFQGRTSGRAHPPLPLVFVSFIRLR